MISILKKLLPQRRKGAKEDAKKAVGSPAGFAPLRLCVSMLFFVAIVSAQTPQATPPPPAPPRSGAFPKPVEQTLPNGLRVIVIERRETPLVSAQLLIKNGGEVDPPELAGLADMTANLLTKGTQTRDATKIAQDVESLGASLDSGARWDSSFATVSGMSSKIAQAMEMWCVTRRSRVKKSSDCANSISIT
jgi:zinc protease